MSQATCRCIPLGLDISEGHPVLVPPGLDGSDDLIGVWSVDVGEGRVSAIRSIVNPDKLRHIGTVADVRALLRGR